jgi:hypothetical protein
MNRWRWWKWIKKKGKRSGSEKEYKIEKIMSRKENNEEREQCVDLGNTKEMEWWIVLKKNDGGGTMVQKEMTHVTWCYNDVKKWGQNISIIDNDFMCGSSWI